ncbi:MAG: hypothetical protein EB037_10455 [Actinobacteria bacterium]|nr:hypothetical protein [Actinomycetota bacterium]
MGRPILPRRISAETLDSVLAAISEGKQTTEDAFMEVGVSRFAVQYALRDGRAAYLLTCRALRTPFRDPDELAAIAAHARAGGGASDAPPAPVSAEPTRAQREAWVRREAAALGLALAEPPGSDTP